MWSLHTHTHTHPFNSPFPGLPGWAGTRKVKPTWILLKQETVSGSGISWAVCKSAPRSRQITTPAPHHSVFLQDGCPSCRPTNSVKALKAPSTEGTVWVPYVIIKWLITGWLSSWVVSMLDSGAEGPGLKSKPRHCRATVLSKLFTPIVPLFTKQRNWQQPS